MAWPPDVADGQIIAASHINAIKNSVATWGGDVNASGYKLNAAGQIVLGPLAVAVGAGSQATGETLSTIDGGSGIYMESVLHRSGAGSGHGFIETHLRRRVDATLMGYVGFGTSYVSIGFGGGAEEVRFQSGGYFQITTLPSSNPGAGTRRFWYDPADGNRVKYAP